MLKSLAKMFAPGTPRLKLCNTEMQAVRPQIDCFLALSRGRGLEVTRED